MFYIAGMEVFRCQLAICSFSSPANYSEFLGNSRPLQVIDESAPSACVLIKIIWNWSLAFYFLSTSYYHRPQWNNNNLFSSLRAIRPLDIVGKVLSVWCFFFDTWNVTCNKKAELREFWNCHHSRPLGALTPDWWKTVAVYTIAFIRSIFPTL